MKSYLLLCCVALIASPSYAQSTVEAQNQPDNVPVGLPIQGEQYAPGLGVSSSSDPGTYGGVRVLKSDQLQDKSTGGLHIVEHLHPPTQPGLNVIGSLPGGGGTSPSGTTVDAPYVDPSLLPAAGETGP